MVASRLLEPNESADGRPCDSVARGARAALATPVHPTLSRPARRRRAHPIAALARSAWLAAALIACDAGRPPASDPQPAARPNDARPHLLVIVADDLGWNDVGYHGSEIRTPHIDALAERGIRAESFYAQSTCSPSRAALLTGRYPMRYGLQDGPVWPWASQGLAASEATAGSRLRHAGYATAWVGKWHLGMATPGELPTRRGFDHFYGSLGGQVDHFTHTNHGGLDWRRDERPVREPGYSSDLLANEAIRLLDAREPDRPLFLVLSFNAPHTPLQAPEEEIERYADIQARPRRHFAAMVTRMDSAIGRVLDAYERAGLARNTLVLFLSDNGGRPVAGASNHPLRGGKRTPFEGGVRVPAIWSWPGRLPAGGVTDAPMHLVDVLPTLLSAAEVAPPADVGGLDGMDLLGLLDRSRTPGEPDRELLLDLGRETAALRVGHHKLVVFGDRDGESRTQLYDLGDDLRERTDLAASQPERVASMSERLRRLEQQAVPSVVGPRKPPPGFRAPAIWGPSGPAGHD